MKKLSVELKDADGRSDAEVTRERWENDRKRNNSVIVDSFKSFLVCPECNKVSVTFDATLFLLLPILVFKKRAKTNLVASGTVGS